MLNTKEKLRNDILTEMQMHLNTVQMEMLNKIIGQALHSLEVVQMETLPATEDKTNEYLIKLYLAKNMNKKSDRTLEQYMRSIKNLIVYTEKSLYEISDMDIEMYLAHYADKPNGRDGQKNKASTVNNERRNISAFYTWMKHQKLRLDNPVESIEPLKEIKEQIDYLNGIELEELRGGCETLRDRALVECLRSTGVRIGELVLIERASIDVRSGDITILAPKTGEYRMVFLDEIARYHVGRYLNTRTDDEPKLFVSYDRNHHPLSDGGIRNSLTKIKIQADMKRRVYPHLMRKTLATTMNKRNCNPQMIQQILGHKRIDTTMRYYAATSPDQLRVVHNSYA